jgi:hypothetical protein
MKMRRTLTLLSLILAAGLLAAGVALAAGSPAVTTGKASSVHDTAAALNGLVNPNGSGTEYVFSYGPTTAYGANTPPRAVGSGAKPLAVTSGVSGLIPGTLYHYRIAAINRYGTTFGADRTFTTTGHPPAAVVTGPPASVTQNTATPTGTINPEGAATTWEVQYGTTTNYGLQTAQQTLPAGTTPDPVSAQLVGLASATLFHYRIVAFHKVGPPSIGADATFFTEPLVRPKDRIAARTTPKRDRRSPYSFTTDGAIRGGGWIPAAQRCVGEVTVKVFHGRRRLAYTVAPVASDCTFAVTAGFRRLYARGRVVLKVEMRFTGNGYLAPASRTNRVTAG